MESVPVKNAARHRDAVIYTCHKERNCTIGLKHFFPSCELLFANSTASENSVLRSVNVFFKNMLHMHRDKAINL